jgi:hypothetical protein
VKLFPQATRINPIKPKLKTNMKTKLIIAAGLALVTVQTLTAQVTYHIYGTREGLVGNSTANGHIIVSRDHFCALPSGTVLNAKGSYTYNVSLSNPANGRTKSNVPVWDVGPWNTTDNYWHSPRAHWTDLPRGKPEAQAAYQDGYNGGHDQYGRSVSNPAGIDLADGTFWDDMGMTGNNWLDVTFNWEAPIGASVIVDNSSGGFSASASWATGTGSTDKYGADYRYRSTAAISDAATWTGNLGSTKSYGVYAWWAQGSNRSSTASYIVAIPGGSSTVVVNQQSGGGQWHLLGTWSLNSGSNNVKLSCWTTTGFIVLADAVKWQ